MATNYTVRPKRNESPERFIKRFTRKCKKLGIIDEYKDRRYFKKPSVKRRLAKKKALARHKKWLAKQRKFQ
jgi:small subunit ribosomal protein S21